MKKTLVLLSALLFSASALADHNLSNSGNYHWPTTTSPFTLTLHNSIESEWDSYVAVAVSDWSQSSKLSITQVDGDTSEDTRYSCLADAGTIRICNYFYGNTGWVGVANVWFERDGHITSANTQMNETAYADPFYDTPAWRQSVVCQELGHDLGLGHQDEDFYNEPLYTCMDYQDVPYEYPNAHDYEQLETIYDHTDSSTGDDEKCRGRRCRNRGRQNLSDHPNSGNWGRSEGRRGDTERFTRFNRDGSGHTTVVTWMEGHGTEDGHGH